MYTQKQKAFAKTQIGQSVVNVMQAVDDGTVNPEFLEFVEDSIDYVLNEKLFDNDDDNYLNEDEYVRIYTNKFNRILTKGY